MESLYRKRKNLDITRHNWKDRCTHLFKVDVSANVTLHHAWCNELCEDNWIWSSPVHSDITSFYFLHDDDAMIFKLKFGYK